jgi:hypothetical protein
MGAALSPGLAGQRKLIGTLGQGVQIDSKINQKLYAGAISDRQQPPQQVRPADVILAVALRHPQ